MLIGLSGRLTLTRIESYNKAFFTVYCFPVTRYQGKGGSPSLVSWTSYVSVESPFNKNRNSPFMNCVDSPPEKKCLN